MKRIKAKVKEWTIDSDTTKLDMSYSKLNDVPSRIRSLRKLEEVHLQGNQIDNIEPNAFEPGIGSLLNLSVSQKSLEKEQEGIKYIDMSGNKLITLPESFGVGALKKSLTYLDLSYNQMQVMPHFALYELENLVHLDLSHNGFSQLTEGVGRLSKLKVLKLNHNNLDYVASDIVMLVELKELWLQHNILTTLPARWDGLEQLQNLDLSYNKFMEIPNGLGSLRHSVLSLNLSHNQIQHLHTKLLQQLATSLMYLKLLDLSYNVLPKVPASLTSMAHFGCIDLRNNPTLYIDKDMAVMTNLQLDESVSSQLKKVQSEKSLLIPPNLPPLRVVPIMKKQGGRKSPTRNGSAMMGDDDNVPESPGKRSRKTHM